MKYIVAIMCLLIATPCFAADESVCLGEIIVTGSRNIHEKYNLGKSITALETDSQEPISSVLEQAEGVRVKRVNGQSGLTTIRLRGMRSIDTALMLDGLPLKDASDPQDSSNSLIGDLLSNGIDKIEILRGASSSLYGSSSQGGVINLIPQSTQGICLTSEAGSNRTFNETVEAGFGTHSISYSRSDSQGMDAHDNYSHNSLVGKSGFEIGEANLIIDYLYNDTDARLNDSPVIENGQLVEDKDDENDRRKQSLYHVGGILTGDITDWLSYDIRSGLTDSKRRFMFLPNSDGSGFFSDGLFRGTTWDLEENLTFRNGHYITTIGHQYEREWLNQLTYLDPLPQLTDEQDQFKNDFYIEESAKFGSTTLTLAGRENTHETAKSRATYDIAISHILQTFTMLKSHFGTAFRVPSLYELDGSFLSSFGRFPIGNRGLSPERSKSFDIGFEQPWKCVTLGSTFFRHDIVSRIDFVGMTYENLHGGYHTDGFESFIEYKPTDYLTTRFSHTHTVGTNLIDIPEEELAGSIKLNYAKWHGDLEGIFVGSHHIQAFDMTTFNVDTLHEDSYLKFNAKISYAINKFLTWYVRGENIFNEHYHEAGFREPGATVFTGATLSF